MNTALFFDPDLQRGYDRPRVLYNRGSFNHGRPMTSAFTSD
jgi:hypothetical protein